MMVSFRKASLCLTLLCLTMFCAAQIPEPMQPVRLVNDYTGLLAQEDMIRLNRRLVAYDDSTSTQICIVILDDLGGYDILQMAYAIGEKWGVGHGHDNGIVLLVKNKTANSGGEVAFATGYGVEARLTDALCRRLIEYDILPHFREGRYYEGLNQAVTDIITIMSGEYQAEYSDGELSTGDILMLLLFFVVIPCLAVWLAYRYEKKHPHSGDDSGPHIFISGPGNFGGFGGFGGGNSVGGLGGFGGFGGGHFGGGGARGGW